jgi:mono/diheme cytochrome c family protein
MKSMNRPLRYVIPVTALCGLSALLPLQALAADAVAGKAVFDAKCRSCHGADGMGNPAIAKMMKVEMKPLGAQTEAEIKTAVTMGVGKMRPVTTVTGADLDNVIAYIHTFKK